ncbi:MAG: glycosyltransferase family 39 protein, partial [Solirubrobacteraceae bacterium]
MTSASTFTPADPPAPTAAVTTSPRPEPESRARPAIRLVIALAAAAPIGVYLWIALHRLGYPYELDWMEGGSVELAARVAAGHSLYAPPSLHFVGWTYTPLYYWLTAGLAKFTGVGFFTLRLVSVVASLVSMVVLARMVTRDGAARTAGLVAAGLFAATFAISGAWFDTGRVDSLFVALTLVTLAWARRARSRRDGLVLGALAFLAFFTKQTALVAVVPVLALLLVTRRRVALPALATLAVLGLGSTLALDATSNGWYRFYVFGELAGQPWAPHVWVQFWTRDILGPQWPLAVLVGAGALTGLTVTTKRRPRPAVLSSSAAYHVVAAAGLIAAALISRVHTGGYANVLMPAYAATALLAGLTCAELHRTRRRIIDALVAGVLLLQFALLAYPIGAQIPTAADRAAGAELLHRLRGLRGPV